MSMYDEGDYEQIAQENALWPWLADDSMADHQADEWNFFDGPETFDEESDGVDCDPINCPFFTNGKCREECVHVQ